MCVGDETLPDRVNADFYFLGLVKARGVLDLLFVLCDFIDVGSRVYLPLVRVKVLRRALDFCDRLLHVSLHSVFDRVELRHVLFLRVVHNLALRPCHHEVHLQPIVVEPFHEFEKILFEVDERLNDVESDVSALHLRLEVFEQVEILLN